MKNLFLKTGVKANQVSGMAFILAISKTKTKNNDLLIAQLSTYGLILVFTITLIAIFGL